MYGLVYAKCLSVEKALAKLAQDDTPTPSSGRSRATISKNMCNVKTHN